MSLSSRAEFGSRGVGGGGKVGDCDNLVRFFEFVMGLGCDFRYGGERLSGTLIFELACMLKERRKHSLDHVTDDPISFARAVVVS